MTVKKMLAMGMIAASMFVSVPAHATSGTFGFDAPAPEAGTGCTRHTDVHYDTTKIPPVWSSGYVVCNG
jgi:hypothetical protein